MKLKKFLQKFFSKKNLRQVQQVSVVQTEQTAAQISPSLQDDTEQQRLDKIYHALNNHLEEIFPSNEYVIENLKKLRKHERCMPDGQRTTEYARNYLGDFDQYHLFFFSRDVSWLTEYVSRIITKICRAQINDKDKVETTALMHSISYRDLKKYFQTDKFKKRRSTFEHNVIGAYLELAQDCEVDDFYMTAQEKKQRAAGTDYDIVFRDDAVKALCYLGLNANVIEKCLEKWPLKWRVPVREKAFVNHFDQSEIKLLNDNQDFLMQAMPDAVKQLQNRREDLFIKWDMLRDYEYYQAHKEAINTWTQRVTVPMKFTPEEVKFLTSKTKASFAMFKTSLHEIVEQVKLFKILFNNGSSQNRGGRTQ
ncbi:MAG: hypothetical protein IJ295_00615 [Clostridia bacterium]|nr:hypothetical protein [Clostridia bacterium]